MKAGLVQKTKGGPVYPAVGRALRKLGEDISLARRARRISVADFASQMGVSRTTLSRLEAGDAGASLNTLAQALFVLGKIDALRDLADQGADDVGLMLMRGGIPKRVRRPKQPMPGSRPDDGASGQAMPTISDGGVSW